MVDIPDKNSLNITAHRVIANKKPSEHTAYEIAFESQGLQFKDYFKTKVGGDVVKFLSESRNPLEGEEARKVQKANNIAHAIITIETQLESLILGPGKNEKGHYSPRFYSVDPAEKVKSKTETEAAICFVFPNTPENKMQLNTLTDPIKALLEPAMKKAKQVEHAPIELFVECDKLAEFGASLKDMPSPTKPRGRRAG